MGAERGRLTSFRFVTRRSLGARRPGRTDSSWTPSGRPPRGPSGGTVGPDRVRLSLAERAWCERRRTVRAARLAPERQFSTTRGHGSGALRLRQSELERVLAEPSAGLVELCRAHCAYGGERSSRWVPPSRGARVCRGPNRRLPGGPGAGRRRCCFRGDLRSIRPWRARVLRAHARKPRVGRGRAAADLCLRVSGVATAGRATFRFGHGCTRSLAIAACLSCAPAATPSMSTEWQ